MYKKITTIWEEVQIICNNSDRNSMLDKYSYKEGWFTVRMGPLKKEGKFNPDKQLLIFKREIEQKDIS